MVDLFTTFSIDHIMEHFPDLRSITQLHQNLIGGKVEPHHLAPFQSRPDLAFRLNETMQCNDTLRKFHQSRDQNDRLGYSLCLAARVCPEEVDAWASTCMTLMADDDAEAQEASRRHALQACVRAKRDCEACTKRFSQEALRLLVDRDVFSR